MPVAGDEGYEKLVICPYDKAHEIRLGRMQFHLEKCRKNYPDSEMVKCPFNATHIVAKVELKYHQEEDCQSRTNWERNLFVVGDTECPVQNLVPVNSGTIPDGGENWDNYEAQGSVLENTRAKAAEKPIYRLMQNESKAKRKAFRLSEKHRMEALKERNNPQRSNTVLPQSGSFSAEHPPLPRPIDPKPVVQIRDATERVTAAINEKMGNLALTKKVSTNHRSEQAYSSRAETTHASSSRTISSFATAASDTSSVLDETFDTARTSPSFMSAHSSYPISHYDSSDFTFEQAYQSRAETPQASSSKATLSYMTADSDASSVDNELLDSGRTSPLLESACMNRTSYASVSGARHAPSVSSNSSISRTSRPSTASSIAASASRLAAANQRFVPPDDEDFCQLSIPGLGRGLAAARRRGKK